MSLKQAILNSSGFFSITSLKNGKKQNKTISFKYCFKNEIGRTDCLVKSCCLVSSHNTLSSATFGDEMTQRLRRKLPYNTEKIFKLRHKDKLIKKEKESRCHVQCVKTLFD